MSSAAPVEESIADVLRETMYLAALLLQPTERSWDRVQEAKRTIQQLQVQIDRPPAQADERERIRCSLVEAHQALGVITELQANAARHQIKEALDHLSEVLAAVEENEP